MSIAVHPFYPEPYVGTAPDSPRVVVPLLARWRFRYTPRRALDEAFGRLDRSDSDWRAVAVPHTWQTYETTGLVHPFIRDAAESDDPYWWEGWGWYRTRIGIDERFRGKRLNLVFDGVQKYCRVYVDGHFVAEHAGGFASFSVDITQVVRWGEPVLVAIAVSNRRVDPRCIPPMHAGNWNPYGGIYRPVRLVITDAVHVPFQGNADHDGGTFVTTPSVTPRRAEVAVRTWLRNDGDAAVACRLVTTVLSPDGRQVGEAVSDARLGAGAHEPLDQNLPPLDDPLLWSPVTPNLYSVQTCLFRGDRLADTYLSPLGLRWYRWDYDRGRLYLNDHHVHLHGFNRHQEYPWMGDAIPEWIDEHDLVDVKHNLGATFMRTCHYSQAPHVYDLTDRLGILVCEEVPNIKRIAFSRAVQKRMVIEMVRRDRNHPSIIMWSMGNETDCAANGAWARAEDPTRIIHVRHVYGGEYGTDEPHDQGQLEMENLLQCTVRGWFCPEEKPLPGIRVSPPEGNGQTTGTEEWQHQLARVRDLGSRGRIDLDGCIGWLYADHGCDREYRNAPLKHVNPKGWVDAYRRPKYVYHLWRANYCGEPVVYLHPHLWRRRYLGEVVDLVVDSNCAEVKLWVNGRLIGSRRPAGEQFWTMVFCGVTVEEGAVEVVGRHDGREVRHRVAMAGAPSALTLKADRALLPADRTGIALLTAEVVDAHGEPVIDAENALRFTVDGPVRLLAPETITTDTLKVLDTDGTMYINGGFVMPVRGDAAPGRVNVTVESPGLRPASVALTIVDTEGPLPEGIWLPALDGVAQSRLPAAAESGGCDSRSMKVLDILYEDIRWPVLDRVDCRRRIESFIRKANPGAEPDGSAWTHLVETLTDQLVRTRGTLIADDYTFAVTEYNRTLAQ